MLPIRLALLAALAMTVQTIYADQQPPDQLQIGNEIFTFAIVDAHGRATLSRAELCPPASDSFVIDQFVKDVLMARKSEINEITIRDAAFAKSVQPLRDRQENIKRFLTKQPANSRISEIYKKQISRIQSEIDAAQLQTSDDYERKLRNLLRPNNRVNRLKAVSDLDKIDLARMKNYASLYAEHIRETISDTDLQNRYKKLVKNKDERLVNVHFFKFRTAFVSSNDKHTIADITDYLKDETTIQTYSSTGDGSLSTGTSVRYPTNMLISAHTIQGSPHWSRHKPNLATIIENPESTKVGSTLVFEAVKQKFHDGDYDIYRVIYISDKAFYPLIDLHATTPDRQQALSFIKNELFESRLENDVAQLRANSHVTRNGEIFFESKNYAKCPTK